MVNRFIMIFKLMTLGKVQEVQYFTLKLGRPKNLKINQDLDTSFDQNVQ